MKILVILMILTTSATVLVDSKTTFLCNTSKFRAGSAGAKNVKSILSILQVKAEAAWGHLVQDQLQSPVIYGAAKCNTGFTKAQCHSCLVSTVNSIKSQCPNAVGAQLSRDQCRVRYETYKF